MNNFAEFWNQSGHCQFLGLLLVFSFAVHIVFLIYRCLVLTMGRKTAGTGREEGVSVIITCANQAELLRENLEAFLCQDYPDFEVIVVDECSEDDTQKVLEELQKKHVHLRTSRIFPGTKFRHTKKLAINIGVLAARHDLLLFSEISCRPATKNWIRCMQAGFDADTAVVVGLSNYSVEGRHSGLRRYFRFLWFWKNLILVRNGIHVKGNGHNMGYRKRYYLEERGFSRHTQEYIAYDSEMVRKLSRRGAVRMVRGEDARVVITENVRKAWEDDYSYHYAMQRLCPWHVLLWDNTDFVFEAAFYLLSLYFVLQNPLHEYFLIPVVLIYLIDIIAVNICLKHSGQKKLFLTSLNVNTFGFLYKWYYGMFSLFTEKKWR